MSNFAYPFSGYNIANNNDRYLKNLEVASSPATTSLNGISFTDSKSGDNEKIINYLDRIQIYTNGTLKMDIGDDTVESKENITLPIDQPLTRPTLNVYNTSAGAYNSGVLIQPTFVGLVSSGAYTFSASPTEIVCASTLKCMTGAPATPSITFSADPDTGIYTSALNNLDFACGGSRVFGLSTGANVSKNRLLIPETSSAGTPALGFENDADTGIFRDSADTISFSTGGTLRGRFSNSALYSAVPVQTGNGSLTETSYGFSDEVNSGLYKPSAGNLALVTGGTSRLNLNSTTVSSTLPIRLGNGSVSAPSYSFTGSTNSGMYHDGSSSIYFCTSGTNRLQMDNLSMRPGVNSAYRLGDSSIQWLEGYIQTLLVNDGTVGAPSIAFRQDTDTGWRRQTSGIIDQISNGVLNTQVGPAHFIPGPDNTLDCGLSSYRWKAVYAVNGTIQTSDQTQKRDIENSPLGLDFINALRPVKFKWLDYTHEFKDESGNVIRSEERKHNRFHYGLIAQEVKTILDNAGISTNDFAGYIDSAVSAPERPSVKGLNYSEFIPILMKAVQQLSSQVQALQGRIEALES